MRTDFTKKPVELLIDTGSQIGLVASDTVKPETSIGKPIYHLTGQQNKVATNGHLIGNFLTDDKTKWLVRIHLVDRKYTGNSDGYVGYDFLKDYGAKIDVHNRILELHDHAPNESNGEDTTERLADDTENKKPNVKENQKKV